MALCQPEMKCTGWAHQHVPSPALCSLRGAEVGVKLTCPLPHYPQGLLAQLQLPLAKCFAADDGLSR